MSFKLTHFLVQELVPQDLFNRYGEEAIRYMDPRLLEVLEALRTAIDTPMTINNYHIDGSRHWSGIRTPESPWYRPYSPHSYGMAFDAVGNFEASEVRQRIKSGEIKLPHPVRLEMGVSWLHVDVMRVSSDYESVTTFYP